MSSSSILISGLPKDVSENDLQMHFQSKNASSGGEIATIVVDPEQGQARIEFVDVSVAKRVLARDHEYQGCHLTVEEHKPSTDDSHHEEQECASVLVSGLSGKFTEDAIQMYFENARKSGGGDVTNVQLNGNKAVVTFASADFAKNVLARTHEYQGCQLTVEEYKPSTDDSHQEEQECASVWVSGLSSKFTEDAIQMYFENARRSGGGDVINVQFHGNKVVVTFASPDIAKRVLARDHEYQGCHLTVEEYKPSTDDSNQEEQERASVLVSGLSGKFTEDAIQMYFENARRSGGGDVTNVKVDGNKAVVTFASADFAKNVLARTHEYQGCHLTVEEYKPSTNDSHQEEQEFSSILVSGLSSKFTEDAILMYFENTRRSGGGDVTNLQLHGNKAVVTFASPGIAKRVLVRDHEYQGCHLTVEEYKPSTDDSNQEEQECASVLVSGLSGKFTEDAIQMYFENARRSGGGDVTNVQLHGNKAVVTFASADFTKNVLARSHEYQGCHLTVEEYKPSTDVSHLEEQESVSILVSGLSSKFTDDAIQMYFENARRSGGGDVTNVQFHGNKAVVTFASPDIAKRVLARDHEYQECHLTVEEYKPSTDDSHQEEQECASVLVSGLSGKFTEDAIQMYFENARRSGGGDVANVQFHGNKAVVTFASPDITKRVLARDHVYQGCHLTVEEHKQSTDDSHQEEHECASVLVGGLSSKFTDDAIQMYFENARRSGGGYVSNVQFHGNKAVVTFESPDIAKRVLARDHEYQGCHLTVEEYKPSTDDSHQEEQECSSVWVSGLSGKFTDDAIQMYFENARRSGGGDVTNVKLEGNKAIVAFASPDIARRVISREHVYQGCRLTVKEYQPSSDDFDSPDITKKVSEREKYTLDECPLTIPMPVQPKKTPVHEEEEVRQPVQRSRVVRVSGISDKTTKDTLLNFFQNTRWSGGGKIEDIQHIPEERLVDITYCRPEDAEQVSLKEGLELDGSRLSITLKEIPKETPKDPYKLHVMRISSKTTRDGLMSFMEAVSGEEVESMLFGSNSDAMITFKEAPDFEKLQTKCIKRPLDDNQLNIKQVNICDCIEVTGLASNTTKDSVFFYFDNPKNDGGDVKSVDMDSNKARALVFFKDPKVVTSVTRKRHIIDGATLKVVPYYSFLGETSTTPGGGKKERVIKVDPQAMEFIKKFVRQEFDQLLQERCLKYTWQQDQGEIVLGCVDPNMEKSTWEKSCETVISYTNHITTEKITVSQQAWKEIIEMAKEICAPYKDKMAIMCKEKERSFTLTGKRTYVSELALQLRDLTSEIEKKIKFEKSKISKSIDLKEAQIELLRFSGFVESLQARCKDLEVTMSMKDLKINFRGPDAVVKEGNITVWETLSRVKEQEMELPKAIVSVVGSEPGKVFIATKLKNSDIDAVISFDPNSETQLIVTAVDRSDVKKAVDLIKEFTSEQSIFLDDDHKQLIHTEKWVKFKRSIHKHQLLRVTEEPAASTIWIAGIKEEVEMVKEKVQSFFDENVIFKQEIKTENGRLKLISRYKKEAIKDIEQSLKNQSVQVKMNFEGNELVVSGTKQGIEQAVFEVQKLINDTKDLTVDLETPGAKKLFSEKKGITLLSGVESNHNCIIERCTQKDGTKPSLLEVVDEGKEKPKMICSYVTPENKKIMLFKGDLTDHRVDGIVNTANTDLKNDCGVAKRIIDKGGQAIQDECNSYISQNKHLVCGEVLVTGPGNLPCLQVIHAVGPTWEHSRYKRENKGSIRESGDERYQVSLLEQTVHNVLKEATEKCKSIALPSVGAGVSGFPVDICATTLIGSVLEYSKGNSHSRLTEIHFVDINDSVIKAFHDEMKRKFGEESSFTDGATPKTIVKCGNATKVKRGKEDETKFQGGNESTTANGMKVMIIVDDLAKRKADAIVNTVSSDLNLNMNPCAKALSDAAGPELQQECKRKGNLPVGQMLVTEGYNVGCKNLFHVSVPPWNNGDGEPVMRSLIRSCLNEADNRGFSSIAFPAIGTGKLGFPRGVVAKVFFEEADAFKAKSPKSPLDEVHLVLFHKDKSTVQAFQDELKRRIPKRKAVGKRARHPYKGDRISYEDISRSQYIGPVRLEIISGNLSNERTDAIVIPAFLNQDLKVTRTGAIGNAIAEAGGPSIQKECDQLGVQEPGSVVSTSAGDLPTNRIFHLVFGRSFHVSRLTEIMVKCLIEAESLKVKSIAIPAIGTGMGKMSPKDAAKALLSAIEKFVQKNPTSVNHIRIVVFQDHMIKDFEKAIEELSKTGLLWSMWIGFKTGVKDFLGINEGNEAYAQYNKYPAKITGNAFSSSEVERKMWLKVFAETDNDLEEAEASIKELMKESSGVVEIIHKAIETLSDSQIAKIEKIERDCRPSIRKIQIDKKICRILIRGDSEYANNVRFVIYEILKERSEEEHARKYATLLHKSVQWYSVKDDFKEAYHGETNVDIEQAYQNSEPAVIVLMTEDGDDKPTRYKIDFFAMTETNLDTNEIIQVERKENTSISLPAYWDPQPTDSNGKELGVHLVVLDPTRNAKEYKNVKKEIEKTSPKVNIIKIERVQNPALYREYAVMKQEMEAKNRSNEKNLFHGTASENCQLINHKGFNRSFCGKNGTLYGKGVYFARDASYSIQLKYSPPDSAGDRRIYMTSVLIGEYTKGESGMLTPPPKKPDNPTVTYDTVVDNVSNPGIYVAFRDNQNYPSYLITFQ